jgi:SAM-dependent methyltransferase/WD40 repeat protein
MSIATREHPVEELWRFVCDGSVIAVDSTPDCGVICATTVGKSVYLLSREGEVLWRYEGKLDNEGWSAAISRDGNFIVVGTASKNPSQGSLYVFARDAGAKWYAERLGSPVWSVAISDDGSQVVASCWNGTVHKLVRTGASYVRHSKEIPGEAGLYGCAITPEGSLAVVCAYERGIHFLDGDLSEIGFIPVEDNGLYRVAIAEDTLVAGLRDGRFLRAKLDSLTDYTISEPVSERPLCGIAASPCGLVVTGSFDGRVYLTSSSGEVIWQYATDGEVWCVTISPNSRLVCVASGDHTVRLLRNHWDETAVIRHASCLKTFSSTNTPSNIRRASLESLKELCLRRGCVQYGYNELRRSVKSDSDTYSLRPILLNFLEEHLRAFPSNGTSHYLLGGLLLENNETLEAARQFQLASHDNILRSMALRKASECFSELGRTTAAASLFRQATAQSLDADARLTLFLLARSLEDAGCWHDAATMFELLVSWDVTYRNVWSRLQLLQGIAGHQSYTDLPFHDYTGSTINLLGGDVGRSGVAESLHQVVKARGAEVPLDSSEVQNVYGNIDQLLLDSNFSRGITGNLTYDLQLFLKYDYGLPEDELKKFLETVNLLDLVQLADISDSLDVGAATGRYPLLLAGKGKRAQGVDIAPEAVSYSEKKKSELSEFRDAEYPKFHCDDVRNLDARFPPDSFDLITCMMGTFAHIPRQEQLEVLQKMYRALRVGGHCVISTWDVECTHLAYLSMYDETQKNKMRLNSPPSNEMIKMLITAGFSSPVLRPFALVAQSVLHGLGIGRLRAPDIKLAAHIDLAARKLFSSRHGEMYMTVAQKA